jgi:universal stress protein E
VTVLYAWQFYGESLLRPRMSADVIAELSGEMEATAKRDLAKALRDAEYAEGHLRTVLVKGEPEQAIPDYLRDHAIDLVVLGTVSRQGLAGMVTGNTAERVLHELRGSVLAVKR